MVLNMATKDVIIEYSEIRLRTSEQRTIKEMKDTDTLEKGVNKKKELSEMGKELLDEMKRLGVDREARDLIFWSMKEDPDNKKDEKLSKIISFAESIGEKTALEYFSAIKSIEAVKELTDERVLDTSKFIKAIGSEAAISYFHAIGITKAVKQLTDERVLATHSFIKSIGEESAYSYLYAISTLDTTEAIELLTDERVLNFASSIGGSAESYFDAIASTKAVKELTNPEVLGNSGFVQSIGSAAAIRYFYAIANGTALE